MLAATGCGSKKDAPAASINGPALGNPQGGETAKPAPQPQRPRPDDPALLHPKVIFDTSLGMITVELDAVKAKLTVDNFLAYADSGYYDQTIFHQVVKDYVVVGGSYAPNLTEKKAGIAIRNEAHNGLKNRRYTIAMARRPDSIDSATSQFFFNLRDNALLDHKDRTAQGYGYCVFGQVVAGQDVLDRIAGVEVRNTDQIDQVPVQPVIIKSIRRTR
jgi:cyclophilin family peptidyl-prolyl cis-trans isomerase